MRKDPILLGGLVVSVTVWMGGAALAADEGADLEAAIEELKAEGLSDEEARELAQAAAADLNRELSTPGGRREGEARMIQGGDVVGEGMTPEEHQLAERVGARANELAGQGLSEKEIDGVLRSEFEKEFSQFKEGLELNYRELPEGRPDLGHEPTSQEREQMERYREQSTVEWSEPATREYERPPQEREYTPPQGY